MLQVDDLTGEIDDLKDQLKLVSEQVGGQNTSVTDVHCLILTKYRRFTYDWKTCLSVNCFWAFAPNLKEEFFQRLRGVYLLTLNPKQAQAARDEVELHKATCAALEKQVKPGVQFINP